MVISFWRNNKNRLYFSSVRPLINADIFSVQEIFKFLDKEEIINVYFDNKSEY